MGGSTVFDGVVGQSEEGETGGGMAATRGLILSRPVTFVTGNAKKLEEVKAILGQSIPFHSLKLDCNMLYLLLTASQSVRF